MSKHIVSGVLLLNKPSGLSSHTALNQAKRLLMSPHHDSKKAGHTGTLDPMATGLLPICLGEATKFSSFGLDADKGYRAVIKLGEKTDTGDKEGEVIKTSPIPTFTQEDLTNIAHALTGEQLQTPPMYSALKKDGKKLYEYARAGVEIEREARPIIIHQLMLGKLDDETISLRVTCSKGTYVRVLGETIAERLGTLGHLTALHRITTGGFHVADAVGIDELAELSFEERFTKLLPIDALLVHLPIASLSDDETARIRLGQRLNIKDRTDELDFADKTCQIRLYHDDKFIGLGQVETTGRLQPIRIVSCA